MDTEKHVRAEIKRLVDKYNKVASDGRVREYNEERTKQEFILPLFRALGWDTENSKSEDEVVPEERVSRGRVDYAFRIHGIPKFFLEAKSLKADLNDPKYAQQAINYSWHKGCTWAVLTDFESVKIFNAEWQTENPLSNHVKTIGCNEFLDRLSELWLLSKKGFEDCLLDKETEKWGKKIKKLPVGAQMLDDMVRWRETLTKNIVAKNQDKKLEGEQIDEAVQRILDRLIFIRVCEDKELESPTLLGEVREWEEKWDKGVKLLNRLREVFRYFEEKYDSELFDHHLCDDLMIDNAFLAGVIKGLYETKGGAIHYDFSAIDADVLGSIYEQYLGYILKMTEKRAKVLEKHVHRKEQGIYYTPTYIVDYIVRNTLGELLKSGEVPPEKIRVLDPACGSGSFLIKAFDVLSEYYKKKGLNLDNIIKYKEIVSNNIYGVDLDPKAIEITRLNLLLKAAEKRGRLPTLHKNIRCGNSLIDDSKIAGQRAFNWEEEFKEIMSDGKFDVIIGNPPYVRIQTLDKNQVDYFNRNYESPEQNYDIYILFIEKGFKLLKEGGILGFILPHKFFQGESGEKIRKFIYQNEALHRIVNFGTNQVFEGATTYTCLLFLQKKKNKKFYYKGFKLGEDFKHLSSISYEEKDIEILNSDKWNFSGGDVQRVLTKIKTYKNDFRSITKKIFKGSSTGNDTIFLLDLIKKGRDTSVTFSSALNQEIELENALLHPFVYGEDARRYAPVIGNKVLLFPYSSKGGNELIPIEYLRVNYPKAFGYLNKLKDVLLNRKVELDSKNFYKFSAARSLSEYEQPKIMIPDMLVSNRISFDEEGVLYHGPAIHSVVFNDKTKTHSPYFYLGILNSMLFWFFIVNTSTALRGNAYRLTPEFLTPFCFPDVSEKNRELYDKIVAQVERILQLNKRLAELGDKKTDERAKVEEEIKKIDTEINELVYKIYGLTEEEKKIVQASSK